MSTRLSGSLLVLIAVVFLLNAGDFAAQDPQQPTPATPPEAPDLSGTYAGTFNSGAVGLTGDTTLTITGNQFTTADGKTGRIVASKSGGYTAVALQVGESTATTPAQIVSLRARKSGNRLTLTSAPGATMKCSFTTGTTARGRRQRTPAATGTEVAAPATAPVPATAPAEPMPAQTPSPSPTVSPTPSPEPTPQPSPEPQPSPAPSPAPTPNPSPMPSPTVSPSPTPSPTPGPRRG